MAKIVMEIKNCLECPKCEPRRIYTSDSWEHAYDYYCKKNGEQIAHYIEWPSEMPPVPDNCPMKG
jgi:hypothetical protein